MANTSGMSKHIWYMPLTKRPRWSILFREISWGVYYFFNDAIDTAVEAYSCGSLQIAYSRVNKIITDTKCVQLLHVKTWNCYRMSLIQLLLLYYTFWFEICLSKETPVAGSGDWAWILVCMCVWNNIGEKPKPRKRHNINDSFPAASRYGILAYPPPTPTHMSEWLSFRRFTSKLSWSWIPPPPTHTPNSSIYIMDDRK